MLPNLYRSQLRFIERKNVENTLVLKILFQIFLKCKALFKKLLFLSATLNTFLYVFLEYEQLEGFKIIGGLRLE